MNLEGTRMHIVVAGHICLDIIPTFPASSRGDLVQPGKLIGVEPATLCTGGVVSNTGVALHRLGVPVKLAGKVGDDRFGPLVLDLLRSQGESLADGMIVSPGAVTSYSVILSPPAWIGRFCTAPARMRRIARPTFPRRRSKAHGISTSAIRR